MTPVSPVRLARLSQGLTLDALAVRVGVDRSQLSRAERGLIRLRPNVARRVLRALQLSPDAFTAVGGSR